MKFAIANDGSRSVDSIRLCCLRDNRNSLDTEVLPELLERGMLRGERLGLRIVREPDRSEFVGLELFFKPVAPFRRI